MPLGDRNATHTQTTRCNVVPGLYEGPRCRDCEGYPDPLSARCTCTITGKRRAGYAGVCGKKKLRPKRKEAPRVRHCASVGCDVDISHKKVTTIYCDECRARLRVFRINRPKKATAAAVRPHREESSVQESTDGWRAWTPEEDAIVLANASRGKKAIARMLNRTESAVMNRLHVLRKRGATTTPASVLAPDKEQAASETPPEAEETAQERATDAVRAVEPADETDEPSPVPRRSRSRTQRHLVRPRGTSSGSPSRSRRSTPIAGRGPKPYRLTPLGLAATAIALLPVDHGEAIRLVHQHLRAIKELTETL